MTDPARSRPGPFSTTEPWDLVSVGYTQHALEMTLPFARHAIELASPRIEACALDVATGPGTLALELAPRVSSVEAIDFSPAMLQQLEARRQALGIGNVRARVGDGQALPFADQSFDVAFSMFGLIFFPDPAQGLRELYRVLRPGGVALVSSWASSEQSPLMALMFGALLAADPCGAPVNTYWPSLVDPQVLELELTSAGFREVSVSQYTHPVLVQSPHEYWETTSLTSAPIAMLKQRMSPDEWNRRSEIAKAYIAEHVRAPTTVAAAAHLGFARR